MQVADNGFRCDVQDVEEMARHLFVKADCCGIVEIAEMLRDEGLAPARDSHRRFQMRAHGKDGGTILAEIDRRWHEAARTAKKGRSAIDDRHDRIIGTSHDRPIMADDQISDAGEPLRRIIVIDHQWLAARIGAGRDQSRWLRQAPPGWVRRRIRQGMKEQMMNRRIGQHQANPLKTGRDGRRQLLATLHQYDRSFDVGKKSPFRCGRRGDETGRGLVRDHDGEWFFLARLAPPEFGHSGFIAGVANQMEAANPFQGDNAALLHGFGDDRDGLAQARAASGTSHRLGMEAAARHVGIVAGVGLAEPEGRHRRLSAVIGQAPRDGEAWAAMGAGRKGVEVESTRGIKDVFEA